MPNAGPADIDNWDIRGLVNLLESIIQPESWDSMAGPGTIDLFAAKLVLSIRQTPEVHGEIRSLLAALRRARYLARNGQTYKSFSIDEGPLFVAAMSLTDLSTRPRQADLPGPEADELKALAVLQEPLSGEQTWRSIPADGHPPQTTIIRHSSKRAEFEFEGRFARLDGDDAAVAYPGLTIVEYGEWAEPLRQIVDGRLPWLPHRTGRELARMYSGYHCQPGRKDGAAQTRFAWLGRRPATTFY